MKQSTWHSLVVTMVIQTGIVSAQASEAASGDCQLLVATGPKGKVYSKLYHDVKTVCGAEVKLCEVESEGGLNNAIKLSGNEAELGFVQEDTLLGMKSSDEGISSLRAVVAANSNLLHIMVARDGYVVRGERTLFHFLPGTDTVISIARFSELKGRPVAAVGSAQHLVRVLNSHFELGLEIIDKDSDEQAIAALKAGEVAGVLCMSGWPNTMVETVARDGAIKLVEYDLPMQAPYHLMRKNYQRLGVFGMGFLAARNFMVTRLRDDGPQGEHVATLQRCLLSHLETLQEGRYEPGWKEVKDMSDTHGWPRFEGNSRLRPPSR
jgi:TRAP-type uncharacterized transport system substrate-binding protein